MAGLLTLVRDLQRRRGRERRGLAVAEGVRLIEEALAAPVPLRGVLVAPALEATPRGRALLAELEARKVPIERLETAEFLGAAATEHPQGIVAVIQPRAWSVEDFRWDAAGDGVVVALDGIQDPGNVGTILRTAWALGAAGVVALPGTVDLQNPKVLRGAMGASFNVPAVALGVADFLRWAGLARVSLWVAEAGGEPPTGNHPAGRVCLVVGNEGAGVTADVAGGASRRVGVKLAPGVDSLNVAAAAAILLYEVTRDA